MVLGTANKLATLATYGTNMVLQAEYLYQEHAPNRTELAMTAFRLWTGEDPYETASDPAKKLPSHGVEGLEPQHHHHENQATLFQQEDLVPWTVFTMVFFVLVLFDNFVLHRKAEVLNLVQSILYTTFWIAVAGMFGVYVWYTRGVDDAFTWGTGYVLEWMLSVDNLFVFHRIFMVFKTPDEQKHKPLFYGIVGAIVFRMIFFLIGELLLHQVTWMHLVFGLFLIWTGYKAVTMDDDDESPEKGWLFLWVAGKINYVDEYDKEGRFFMPVMELPTPRDPPSDKFKDSEKQLDAETGEKIVVVEEEKVLKYKPTRLVLVVVCLEVTDLIFAVDSVSAIVAQVPDLFLAYTACVFAMLGLRAMFFAIDELVKMFSLLSYAVAFILIFIGLKLILRSWIHIPPIYVCCLLISVLVLSVVLSLIYDKMEDEENSARECVPEDTDSPNAVHG